MSLIDSINSEGSTIDVNSLIEPQRSTAPFAAVRNRAATAALLNKESGTGVEDYQAMLAEAVDGGDTFRTSRMETVNKQYDNMDMKAVINAMSDPNLDIASKERIVKNVRNNVFLRDSSNNLLTKGLESPVAKETPRGEAVRINTADQMKQMYEDRQKVQGLVNAHALSLDDSSPVKITAEAAELMVLPFMNSVNVAKITAELKKKRGEKVSIWDYVKATALPGQAMRNEKEYQASLTAAQQLEYQRTLNETLGKQSGLIFSTDNQYAQYDKQMSLGINGEYSNTEQYLDNISSVLDVVGLGSLTRRLKGAKTVQTKPTPSQAIPEAPTAPLAPSKAVVEAPAVVVEPVVTKADGVATLLGGTGKKVVEEVPEKKIAALFKRIELNNTVRVENPASPAKIVQQANPDEAVAIHTAIVKSGDDTAAEALYGTSRVDAIASDILPQIVVDGRVTTRVPDIGRGLREIAVADNAVIEVLYSRGMMDITQAEKAEAVANQVNDFRGVTGLTYNNAMSSIVDDGGRVKVQAVYGTPEGGWLRAEDAIEQTVYALRNKQVDPKNIEILEKQGLDHVPVKLEDVVGKDGNYMVRVNAYEDISLSELQFVEQFDVKRNWADRFLPFVSNNYGTLANRIMDHASMLPKEITGAAAVAVNMSARLNKVMMDFAKDFAKQLNALPRQSKDRVQDYIVEANQNQIAFDPIVLKAQGWSDAMVSSVAAWRKYWDNHYFLENYDVVKTTRQQGYQLLVTPTEKLTAKPIAKNQNIGKFYDPSTGKVVQHTKLDGDALYDSNGTYAKLRRPISVGGDDIEHIIVRNTPTENLRAIRDNDVLLNYREGYYQIQYAAPKFIEKAVMVDGVKVWKAVAVAGDTKEAEFFRKGQAANGGEWRVRGDDRALDKGSDAYWDVNAASGRISQRVRGKTLEDAAGLNHLGDGSYVVNPVDSAIRAARSISGRTMMRPMLENAKERFLKQYESLVEGDGMGGSKFPSRVDQLVKKGEFTDEDLANARTSWVHINYLENGYINSIDQGFKYAMHYMADTLGNANMTKSERLVRLANETGLGPVGALKSLTFMALIGSHVLRQLVVQAHQGVRTLAYNPVGWASGKNFVLLNDYLRDIVGVKPLSKDGAEFVSFVKAAGVLDNVDQNNLVRGVLADAAETNNRFVRVAKTAYNLPRKIGFDIGEMANQLAHAVAVYDLQKRRGFDFSKKITREEAYSLMDAISYGMNKAGDMPYNQTSASLILQFMQAPHKAMLQITNRRIPTNIDSSAPVMTQIAQGLNIAKNDRMRLVIGDLIMWGPPTMLISDWVGGNILSEDPKLRDFFVYGLESMMLNNFFTQISGKPTEIDYSSLSPADSTGWRDAFKEMMTGGPLGLFLNSPTGQLFFKEGNRTQTAFRQMAGYFHGYEDFEKPGEEALVVLKKFAQISSGFSAATRTQVALETGKYFDALGNVVDNNVDSIEAYHLLLGFAPKRVGEGFKVSKALTDFSKTYKEDVIQDYKAARRYYAEALPDILAGNPDEVDAKVKHIQQVVNIGLKRYHKDPEAMKIINAQIELDFNDRDQTWIYNAMKALALPNGETLRDKILTSPVKQEDKDAALEYLEMMKQLRNDVEQSK